MSDSSPVFHQFLEKISPGPVIWVPLELAFDHCLAEPVFAVQDYPADSFAEMDGFAFASSPTGPAGKLRLTQPVTRDDAMVEGWELQDNETVIVRQGERLPPGTNAVAPPSLTSRSGDILTVAPEVTAGCGVNTRGGIVEAGGLLLNQGSRLTPWRLGLLAAQGFAEIPVHVSPLVHIITVGNELVPPGAPLFHGEAYDCNRIMLHAAVRSGGGTPVCQQCPDNHRDVSLMLDSSLEVADMVLIVGGMQWVRWEMSSRAGQGFGAETVRWTDRRGIRQRLLMARLDTGATLFGLPDAPALALDSFHRFVLPVIQAIMGAGRRSGEPPAMTAAFPGQTVSTGIRTVEAPAGESMNNPGPRPHYLRVILEDGKFFAHHEPEKDTAVVCVLRLEAGVTVLPGDTLEALLV